MMKTLAERLRDAARLVLGPEDLIDRFLDWIEDVSAAIVPARVNGLAVSEMPTNARLDPIGD